GHRSAAIAIIQPSIESRSSGNVATDHFHCEFDGCSGPGVHTGHLCTPTSARKRRQPHAQLPPVKLLVSGTNVFTRPKPVSGEIPPPSSAPRSLANLSDVVK